MMSQPLLSLGVATATSLILGPSICAVLMLRRISESVGFAPPTSAMLEKENPISNCALFRHLPKLANNLAWRSLGGIKTPVHICRVPSLHQEEGRKEMKLEFSVKREDLISPIYGGNKIRTLQHQLAICESRRERGEKSFRQLVSLGSGGSNQVVATVVHARSLGWDGGIGEAKGEDAPSINVCWFDKDEPDFDNTLNMLSVLSFPNIGFKFNWGDSVGRVANWFRVILDTWTQTKYVPMMLGGNCPAGVLGQVGGVLELAEQIIAGESPDPSCIYVPVGSGCTISGLILGTVLVRYLNIPALSHVQIVGCNVHPGFAKMDRVLNLHTNPRFGYIPLTITYSVKEACRALKKLGGPNLELEALEFIKNRVILRADADVVGLYGAHSNKTRSAARLYDEKGVVTDSAGREVKELWLCGHFAAKAFQPLLRDLEDKAKTSNGEAQRFMLWMTKSAVQPLGTVDEWSAILKENDIVKKWANQGKAESCYRPGFFSMMDGKPEDHRSVMTKIL